MHSFHPVAAAAVLALCAATAAQAAHHEGAHMGQDSGRAAGQMQAGARGNVAEADREFMKDAAESGHLEVQASRLALSKAVDAQVKDYARRLIADHTRADAQLRKIAGTRGVTLPAEPSLAQKARLKLLETADGADFDRRYIENLGVEAHRETIERFRRQVAEGRDAQVKAFAQQTLPTLEQHLKMAQDLQGRIGGRGAAAVDRRGERVAAGAAGATAAAGASGSAGARVANVDESELKEAHEQIREAVQVVQTMKADPRVADALARARGVFIMPTYGRGALGVGVQGGEGVLLVRQGENRFSGPVFYNMGGISLGLQAGASGGEVALLLMTDKAVNEFASGKKFSLNADAGLTVANWSRRTQISGGKVQDVIVWSNARGAYAGASIGVNDVMIDDEANRAYYRRAELSARQIIDGRIENPHHNTLGMVLGR